MLDGEFFAETNTLPNLLVLDKASIVTFESRGLHTVSGFGEEEPGDDQQQAKFNYGIWAVRLAK